MGYTSTGKGKGKRAKAKNWKDVENRDSLEQQHRDEAIAFQFYEGDREGIQ